jgi:hypothetical protein
MKIKETKIAALLVFVFVLVGSVYAADLTVPHNFYPGTAAKSSEINENFGTIYSEVNMLKRQSSSLSVTQAIDMVTGSLPVRGTFSSNGGQFMVIASGSGWGNSGAAQIGMSISIDGTVHGYAKSFTNEGGSHKAFVMNPLVVGVIGAGNHTVTLSSWNGTATDYNDFYSVTIVEF